MASFRRVHWAIVAAALVNAFARADQPAGGGADLASVVVGNSNFAFDLYGRLKSDAGNLFVSPLSISTALGMTYAGARGATAAEMAKALRFEPPAEKLHSGFAELMRLLNADAGRGGLELHVANALWVDREYKLLEEFTRICAERYEAGVQSVDFKHDPDAVRKTINAWVAKRTNDKIRNLLPEKTVDPLTRLVLTNAVYFKSAWRNEFQKAATQDEPFFTPNGEKKAPLMHQLHAFAYAERDDAQVIELPYRDDATSMVVILPKQRDGLAALEAEINAQWLALAVAALKEQQVSLTLPRFTNRYTRPLNDDLAALGMKEAFSDHADFSGIDGKKDLFISLVIHQAFVDVNEEGTEAAAATAVVGELKAARPKEPVEFRADHPFIYLIRHRVTGAILFLGRVVDPTAS